MLHVQTVHLTTESGPIPHLLFQTALTIGLSVRTFVTIGRSAGTVVTTERSTGIKTMTFTVIIGTTGLFTPVLSVWIFLASMVKIRRLGLTR